VSVRELQKVSSVRELQKVLSVRERERVLSARERERAFICANGSILWKFASRTKL